MRARRPFEHSRSNNTNQRRGGARMRTRSIKVGAPFPSSLPRTRAPEPPHPPLRHAGCALACRVWRWRSHSPGAIARSTTPSALPTFLSSSRLSARASLSPLIAPRRPPRRPRAAIVGASSRPTYRRARTGRCRMAFTVRFVRLKAAAARADGRPIARADPRFLFSAAPRLGKG